MTNEEAIKIAKKYVKNDVIALELARELIIANIDGYKEASSDFNEAWGRITAGKPDDKKTGI
jgi:hypothetical protein